MPSAICSAAKALIARNGQSSWCRRTVFGVPHYIWVRFGEVHLFCLELLKCAYGLNDAPLAFPLCQGDFAAV